MRSAARGCSLRPTSRRSSVSPARSLSAFGVTSAVGRRFGVRRLLVAKDLVEELLVEPGSVERVAPAAVGERQPSRGPDVGQRDRGPLVPGRVRDGGAGGDDVGAHAVHLEGRADLGDLEQRGVAERHLGHELLRDQDPVGQPRLGLGVGAGERVGVGVVRHPPAHHLDALRGVARRGHLDGQPEPVEQLGAELALLGVHGADEHEAGGVLDRDAVALDGRAAHGGGVEEQVDEVVVEQVDLVDVQDPAVGAGQQAGLVVRLALRQRPLEVQRAEHPVLGGADGQLDEPHRPGLGGRVRGERSVGRQDVPLPRV